MAHTPRAASHVSTLRIITRDGAPCDFGLQRPIPVFSRSKRDLALRADAIGAGCFFYPQRARRFTTFAGGWRIHTNSEVHEVDFLVGADGARSVVRPVVASRFEAADLALALGFYVPGCHHQKSVIAAFQEPGFQGYLWSFPRVDHSSVGILRWLPEANAADLRLRVTGYIRARYPDAAGNGSFYAACVPSLSAQRLHGQRVCGASWALVGDAAGFADAITGEGIFYALRSAELLAEAVGTGDPNAYENRWRLDFGRDLLRAARLKERFYCSTLFRHGVAEWTAALARRSPTAAGIARRFICGESTYDLLLQSLLRRSPRILWEALRPGFR